MNSNIRDKQIRDVLEADGQYDRMVFDRVRNASKNFIETVRPKSLRDEEKEVNIDIIVEKMDGVLKKKISALQYYVQTGSSSQQKREAYSQIVNYNDLVSLYNSAVRIYNDRKLNMTSKEFISAKIQKISTDIDILVLSLDEYVNNLLNKTEISKSDVALIQALSTFKIIKQQLTKGVYNTISIQDVASNFNNDVLSRPDRQRQNLNRLVDLSKAISSRALNIPSFDNVSERIKEKEAELDIKRAVDKPTKLLVLSETIAGKNDRIAQIDNILSDNEDVLDTLINELDELDENKSELHDMTYQIAQLKGDLQLKKKQLTREEIEDKSKIIEGIINQAKILSDSIKMNKDIVSHYETENKALISERNKLEVEVRKMEKQKPKQKGRPKVKKSGIPEDNEENNEEIFNEEEDNVEEEKKGSGKFLQIDRYTPSQPLLFNDKKNNSYKY